MTATEAMLAGWGVFVTLLASIAAVVLRRAAGAPHRRRRPHRTPPGQRR
jgi:hypothetical protein